MIHVSSTTGTTIAVVALSYIAHNVMPNWVADTLETIAHKLLIKSRHSYIVYTHAKRHQLPSFDHAAKLKQCQDHPCDLLHKSPHDLGLR